MVWVLVGCCALMQAVICLLLVAGIGVKPSHNGRVGKGICSSFALLLRFPSSSFLVLFFSTFDSIVCTLFVLCISLFARSPPVGLPLLFFDSADHIGVHSF